MPRALEEGKTYVVTNEVGDKKQFTYRGRAPDGGKLRLEVDGEVREYREDLTDLAQGGYSAIAEVDTDL